MNESYSWKTKKINGKLAGCCRKKNMKNRPELDK